MKERSVTHSTFVIERSYAFAPQKVYAAFADPAKKRRWFAEGGHGTVDEFTTDFRVGGRERTRWRMPESSPFPGTPLTNDTVYQDIVPECRIVFAYAMTIGDHRMSSSQATVEFIATEKGTKLIFTEQGAYFEGSDGAQMREAGWQKILEHLTAEVAR